MTEEQETESQDDMLPRLDSEASRPELWKPVPDTGGQRLKKYRVCGYWKQVQNHWNRQLSYCAACLCFLQGERKCKKLCVGFLLLLLLSLKAFNHSVAWMAGNCPPLFWSRT